MDQWDRLSALCVRMGTVTQLKADMLAKYIISENEYLRVTNKVTMALNAGDSIGAEHWISAQIRLQKESLALASELGLTVASRRSRGILYPGDLL